MKTATPPGWWNHGGAALKPPGLRKRAARNVTHAPIGLIPSERDSAAPEETRTALRSQATIEPATEGGGQLCGRMAEACPTCP